MTTGTRRLPRPGRRTILLLVAAVALIAFILYDLNSTVRIVWYQVINERTIVVTVGVAPHSWTRVTEVRETSTEVRIKVESFTFPQLGRGPVTRPRDHQHLTGMLGPRYLTPTRRANGLCWGGTSVRSITTFWPPTRLISVRIPTGRARARGLRAAKRGMACVIGQGHR